jgi:hypothetical protein
MPDAINLYPLTLSDQLALTELGCAPVVSWEAGTDAMRLETHDGAPS